MPRPLSRRRLLQFGALPLAAAACRRKPTPFPGFALVVTGLQPTVAVVDLAAFTLAGHLTFPTPITQVLYWEPTRTVYALGAEPGVLYAYDWPRRKLAATLPLGARALEARFDPNGVGPDAPAPPALWVSLAEPASALRIPLAEFLVHTRVRFPRTPRHFDVSPYHPHLAATLEGGGIALVKDAAKPEPTLVREDEDFGLLRFRSDGRQCIAANHSLAGLSFVRAADGQTVVDLPISLQAKHFCFKPDGGQLFVTDGVNNAVTIVYPYSTEVDRPVLAGASPGAMVACTNPPYLLVANRASSDVSILDPATGRLVAVVAVGSAPCHLALTPDNQYAFALNYDSGDMAVIRLSAVRSRRNKTAPLFTMIPVGEAPRAMTVVPG